MKKVIVEVPEDYTRIRYSRKGDECSMYYAKEVSFTPESKIQQPSVPIQFVWHDGCLYHEDSCRNMELPIEENCTVEQIGAVLYVRGE